MEYAGDFQGLDLSPVTTAALKGLLTPVVKDDVNFVNAPIIAKERGIRVTETTSADTEDYLNLLTLTVHTPDAVNRVAGTIFGRRDSRVVKINSFRLEMIPCGHTALITNINKPGAIGSIGKTLGEHGINIGQMQVGADESGDLNVIFLSTDTPIPDHVADQLRALPLVQSVTPLEFPLQRPEFRPSTCTV
jgi:D-3-phosphoglycerate dehydrogenase